MTIQITTTSQQITVTIHNISWSDKLLELDQEMRKQDFWQHEGTQCSLDSVLPCPDEPFSDQLTDEIRYNDYNWDDEDLHIDMYGDDYDEAKMRQVIEKLNTWSSRLRLEEVHIYENEDENEIIIGFIDDDGDEVDFYRFDYEVNEDYDDDDDDDDDQVSESPNENNFLDDIFSPAPNVVRVPESSGNEDRDRALKAAREAAQWFSDKLGISIDDEI